jgi:hypothetical protein
MTDLTTTLVSALVAGVIAAGGLLGGTGGDTPRTAVVIDAALARDGRDLIDPRLRALDSELRIPRTQAEAETDLRYLAARGYRLEVAGPASTAAAKATGVNAGSLASFAGSG